ncbi:hypothetical protein [Isoptericola croceus]|uniref:hypothetical protein n=1 Tax=Isoptericola croceus TaxID=3031406 RepID=UPI0023F9F808|nr:hypothetical protein [Isoptericola croceus]
MEELFARDDLDHLHEWGRANDSDETRALLLAEFARLRNYGNATEWNRLVRVCEALALLGWGAETAVEAIADRWINGSMYTSLKRADFSLADGGERGWVVRGGMLVLDGATPTTTGARERLDTQRVMLPKNPLRLTRFGHVQREAVPFAAEAERLRGLLDQRLARDYGAGFGYAGIRLAWSFPDGGPGLAKEYFHAPADVIARDGVRSFVRPRLDVGRMSRRKGETMLTVTRHYTAAEAPVPLPEQCAGLADDLRTIVAAIGTKLLRKAPGYRVDALRADLDASLTFWMGAPSGTDGVSHSSSYPSANTRSLLSKN